MNRYGRCNPFFVQALQFREFFRPHPGDALQRFLLYCLSNGPSSRAQLFQDLLVAFMHGEKQGGYFVEFGATNGVDLSNTLLLESRWGWAGLLAEPARCWHGALKANRKARLDFRCVWSESGRRLSFNETPIAELSTIDELSSSDMHEALRRDGHRYEVETISLVDLLAAHCAPRTIDYLSIDTEGSEFQILSSFDFRLYSVGVITVEHNHVEAVRANIHQLLSSKGFVRVLEYLSLWDDWYVNNSLLAYRANLGDP